MRTHCEICGNTENNRRHIAREMMFGHRDEFDLVNHASGPNLDRSLRQMLELIERYSGIEVSERFQALALDREMKWHAKYARQNGIHTTPTFMVDGLVVPDMSSGDDVAGVVIPSARTSITTSRRNFARAATATTGSTGPWPAGS